MVFASRAFRRFAGVPFHIFRDHFVMASELKGGRSVSLRLDGGDGCRAALSFVGIDSRGLPRLTVTTGPGDRVRANRREDDRIDYQVPASGRVRVTWEEAE